MDGSDLLRKYINKLIAWIIYLKSKPSKHIWTVRICYTAHIRVVFVAFSLIYGDNFYCSMVGPSKAKSLRQTPHERLGPRMLLSTSVSSVCQTIFGCLFWHERLELNLIPYKCESFITRSRFKLLITEMSGQIERSAPLSSTGYLAASPNLNDPQ